MSVKKINGELYKKMVINGTANIIAHYEEVDSLNVFPLPDGDTGTNMRMTMEAGAFIKDEVASLAKMATQIAHCMRDNARGNSGVILSQIFRGIQQGFNDQAETNAIGLAKAFKSGAAKAYKSVGTPVEGTILTVVREASDYAAKMINKNSTIEDYFVYHLEEARKSLERTPDLLPVLKDAGVVDSGGKGYLYIVEGMYKALLGEMIPLNQSASTTQTVELGSFDAHSTFDFGYCTEFILQLLHAKVNLATFNPEIIAEHLNEIGESLVFVHDEDIIKIHVHTHEPGIVLNYCQQFGEFLTIKIENMSVQHNAVIKKDECECDDCIEMRKTSKRKKYAVVAVANGEGLINTFKAMGVDYVVSGGQTMNPSTDDFNKAFDTLNADNIIVFPNNSNIILAATQAGRYYKNANVMVAPSKSIAQGYSALTMLDFTSGDNEQIMSEIEKIISNVTTCLVSYSIRNAEIDGLTIHEGDYLGVANGKIVASELNRFDTIKKMLASLDLEEKEIITIIYGKDVNENDVKMFTEYLSEEYEHLEVDIIDGKQAIYSYIISLE